MDRSKIIRAWKDPEYRARLSPEEREALPASPSGEPMMELEEAVLRQVAGGRAPETAVWKGCQIG